MIFPIVLTLMYLANGCFADNILVFLPSAVRSHYIQVEPLLHALAIRGHNVTELSPFPPENKIPNHQHIFLSDDAGTRSTVKMNWAQNTKHSSWGLSKQITSKRNIADSMVPSVLGSSVFQNLTQNDNKFDVIFAELYFYQEAFVVLGHIFKAPIVVFSSNNYFAVDILRYSGALNAAAYLPDKRLGYAGSLSLFQRLQNAWAYYATMLYNEYFYYPEHDALLSQHIPGPLPTISEMLGTVSIHFLTANIALDGAKIYPPNIIEMSGMHLKEAKPLDEELQSIMDNSKFGVIFISFGTMLKMSQFKTQDIDIFLSVFKELNQTVLWKSDLNSEMDSKIPKNVYVRDWFDQVSILAHPNCALFVTHGGVSSIMEAVKYSVPVVGMPFFADQFSNIANAVYRGYGIQLLHKNLTESSLGWALKTALEDPRFKESIDKASKVFTDRPMSSLDSAIYWTEYVIRHNGAHHLKPLTVQMPWYQVFLLDVIAIYLFGCFIFLFCIIKIISLSLRTFFFKSNTLFKEKND